MQKKTLSLSLLLLLATATLLVNSCTNRSKKVTALDPAFSSYIAAHTFGVISAQHAVEIRFTSEPKNSTAGAQVADKKLFQLQPKVPGKLLWKSENILQFIPEKPLKQGTTYTATIQLDRLFDVPAEQREYTFEFATIPQHITPGTYQNVPYANDNSGACKIEGHFHSTDILAPEQLPTLFKALLNGKEVVVKWASIGTKHTFELDSVVRDLNDQQLRFELNGSKAEFEQKETFNFLIPSVDNFQVLHVRTTTDGTPKITITFSDPIDPNSVVKGFITLNGADNLRTEVEGATLNVYPEKKVSGEQKLVIQKQIKNSFGYSLKAIFERPITFASSHPAVAFLSEGNILPSTDGLKIGFKAVNLKAVDIVVMKIFQSNVQQFFQTNTYEGSENLKNVARPVYEGRMDLPGSTFDSWQVYGLDLEALIRPEPGAIYRVELHFRQSYSTYPCVESQAFTVDAATYTPANFDAPGYDYYSYWDHPNYSWAERENPCHPTYYYEGSTTAAKNILASNIGLIVKANGRGTFEAIATDLRTAEPLSGVTITLYNLQQQAMASANTNNEGMATIQTTDQPFLAIAAKDKERTYLRIDEGSSLSLSAFDVSGSEVREGLKGFIYGERGVWRPGDSLFLHFILDDSANPLPKGHPIVFALQNPQGQLIHQQTRHTPAKIVAFHTRTLPDAPTGYYLASVQIGGAKFTKAIRIEAVKPNRLRIQVTEQNGNMLTPDQGDIVVDASWLTGASAGGYKAVVEMAIEKGSGRFKDFPDFHFQDKVGHFYSNQQPTITENLDASGALRVRPDIGGNNTLPGILDVSVFTRVFEPGGDFSVNRTVLKYAPFKALAGIKTPQPSNRSWLNTGEQHAVQVASLSPTGEKLNRKLQYEIYEVGWSWWYNRSRGEGFYLNDKYITKVVNGVVRTQNGFGTFDFQIDAPKWGHFLIRVCDTESGHCTAETVYLDWPMSEQRAKKGGSGPAMLRFWADKEQYQPGESAIINIPSTPDAQLLVSVESGGQIFSKQWVKGTEGFTAFELPITDKMAPNVYVFVAQIQPHGQTANDLPIRSYGILPLAVEDPKTVLQPIIQTANEWKPNEKYQVTVSELQGRTMEYTIAIVDEGLLGLTNFKTPNPHEYFFSKEALGIRTWDMYNHVVNAYGGRMEQLMAIGGGDDLNTGKSKTNMRFVPVVAVIPPTTLKKGATGTHEFTMPNYVGAVRVMVVAAAANAYGHAEKEVAVKLPLMAQTTLPRVLGPRERIAIPIQLFAMDKAVKTVNVTAKVTGDAKLVQGAANVVFNQPGEALALLELETGTTTGPITVHVTAQSGSFKATDKVNVMVRHSAAAQTLSKWQRILPGESSSLAIDAIGIRGSNSATVSISGMPDVNLHKRLNDLIDYPHGCLEQQLSRVFPQLFLDRFVALTQREKEKINTQYSQLIAHLLQLQHPSGGLRFWPGSNTTHDWGSTYALHFLVSAEKQGFSVPSGLKLNLIRYQKEQARKYVFDANKNHLVHAQVYRLYVLALAGETELGAMNRIRTQVSDISASLLATAYFLSGQQTVAQEVFGRPKVADAPYQTPYTFGSSTRDKAQLLTCAHLLNRAELAQQLAEQLATRLASERWMSTQETAWSLIALAAYFEGVATDVPFEGTLTLAGIGKENITGKGAIISKKLKDQGNYKATLQNTGKTPIYLRLSATGLPDVGEEVPFSEGVSLSVTYLNTNREVISVDKLPQGTDFFVRVVIQRTNSPAPLNDLVLSQIFPSGWEILKGPMDESEADYRDFRDNSVYTYFDLQKQNTKTFEVRLNATYRGTFYLPPVQVEGMYAKDVGALKGGKTVEVY